MVKMKATGGDADLIPENEIVDVLVANVELRSFVWDQEEVEKLRWVFTVTEEGDWKGRDIYGDTSTVFTAHPNCKAYNWVAAITGKAYEAGEQFDTDSILGMPCRIMISHKTDRQGRTWMRAKEVLASKGAVQKAQQPQDAPF